MITPLDIQQKQFGKAMRGYNGEEVDAYLNLIILEMDNLIKENEELKAANAKLEEEMSLSRTSGEELVSTLETAKALMNEISASAEKRAELIIRNAELDAEVTRREAVESAERLLDDSRNLRGRVTSLRERYREMLEDELSRFDRLSEEIFAEANDIIDSLPDTESEQTVIVENLSDITADAETPAEGEVDLTKTIVNIK